MSQKNIFFSHQKVRPNLCHTFKIGRSEINLALETSKILKRDYIIYGEFDNKKSLLKGLFGRASALKT